MNNLTDLDNNLADGKLEFTYLQKLLKEYKNIRSLYIFSEINKFIKNIENIIVVDEKKFQIKKKIRRNKK